MAMGMGMGMRMGAGDGHGQGDGSWHVAHLFTGPSAELESALAAHIVPPDASTSDHATPDRTSSGSGMNSGHVPVPFPWRVGEGVVARRQLPTGLGCCTPCNPPPPCAARCIPPLGPVWSWARRCRSRSTAVLRCGAHMYRPRGAAFGKWTRRAVAGPKGRQTTCRGGWAVRNPCHCPVAQHFAPCPQAPHPPIHPRGTPRASLE